MCGDVSRLPPCPLGAAGWLHIAFHVRSWPSLTCIFLHFSCSSCPIHDHKLVHRRAGKQKREPMDSEPGRPQCLTPLVEPLQTCATFHKCYAKTRSLRTINIGRRAYVATRGRQNYIVYCTPSAPPAGEPDRCRLLCRPSTMSAGRRSKNAVRPI